jgi:anti-sigma regulatory factor (Ser/Thr protein kinase)
MMHASQEDPLGNRIERLLPPAGSAASAARCFVRTALTEWGRAELVDDAALITAELFNNALMHAPSKHYVLAVERGEGEFRIEIWDSSERRPQKRDPADGAETGRGLHLIEALSAAWGSRLAASGKCVWAILLDPEKGGDAE